MAEKKSKETEAYLTIQALQRMPYYLHCLEQARDEGILVMSATSIANTLGLGDVLVRKDIGAVSTMKGKPKAGFQVNELIEDIQNYMGCNDRKSAVIAGAGSLGTALLRNDEFEEYGLFISAAFDIRPELIGTAVAGIPVYHVDEMEAFCRKEGIRLGIITTPLGAAQGAADSLVRGGIRAIWNFALVNLAVPEGILVQNENLASSLAMLSHHIRA
ncbi:MAG: redox-sensing transcriptional repressor Rex [Lachnospiraceae bacterium]|nr:redox-sensing transcriptional repressor Rex [Lachnospiraceae bacterium]